MKIRYRPCFSQHLRYVFFIFFFFQAEDGIRDHCVTGVQTCALPIYRAEGVPLYAVETVRMLLDRGLLERRGDRFAVTGPVDVLEVPETLHALIAARLDRLPAPERRVIKNAAVAGKTFTREAVSALDGQTTSEVEAILGSLVRKELLGVQTDPRSPERG